MAQAYDYLLKLLIIGDAGTGKSNLLTRFTKDLYNETYISTCGVDFSNKLIEINGKRLKLQIWDTAGQERFRSITNSYYRGTQGFIVIYDVTRLSTFKHVPLWLNEISRMCNEETTVVIVGNKIDLAEREVSTEQGEDLAKQYGYLFFEVSAKDGTNVQDVFASLVKDVKGKIIDNPPPKQKESEKKGNQARFKVIFLGTSYAGKTSLIMRFKTNKFTEPKTTIGVEWETFLFPNCVLEIWDTAGQERHKSLTRQYLRGGHCCILVFDVTDRKSFNRIQEYKDMFERENDINTFKYLFVLVGNKVDRVDDRVVSQEEASNLLLSLCGSSNQYSSAATGIGVREIFQYIADTLPKIYPSEMPSVHKSVILIQHPSQDSQSDSVIDGCCFGGSSSSSSSPSLPSKSEAVKQKTKQSEQQKDSPASSNSSTTEQKKTPKVEHKWENDIYEQYIYPFHVIEFDDKQIFQIACDISIVATSSSGKIYSWGGRDRDSKDSLYASSFTSMDVKIKKLHSSGSELVAIDQSNNVFINTLWGATPVSFVPQRQIALNKVGITYISFGDNGSALITKDGDLFTWGIGKQGNLGHGNQENNVYPQKVVFFEKASLIVKQIACGEWHMLALSDSGIVFSWGNNSMGQLGMKTNENYVLTPTQIPNLSTIIDVGCGENFSMALNREGLLYTWGDPTKIGRKSDSLASATTPMPINHGGLRYANFAAGPTHSGAITTTGKLMMWGGNRYAQLGLGYANETVLEPTLVDYFQSIGEKLIGIACGGRHTAAIASKSSTTKGFLYTFGFNKKGQLGQKISDEFVKTPRKVETALEIQQVACGSSFTLALGIDNKVYGSGSNRKGQLGIRALDTPRVNTFAAIDPSSFLPEERIRRIIAYSSYSMALTDQNVYAWGSHPCQINTGLRQLSELPANTVQVACGIQHTVALDNKGQVYSWGPNLDLLAQDPITPTPKGFLTPQIVEYLLSEKSIQIATGAECTFVVTQKGQVYWWGKFGRFTMKRPKRLKGILNNVNITKVACTHTDILFLSSIGDVYRWKISENEPSLIPSIQDKVIRDIACGLTHCLLLSMMHKVYTFGRGEYGQLGCGKQLVIPEPILIPALESLNVSQIACGRASSVVLTNKHEVYCFGNFCNTTTPPTIDNEDTLYATPQVPETNSTPTFLAECLIEDFSMWGVINLPFTFTIIAQNELQRRQKVGGDIFRVLARGPGNQVKAHIKDNGDGSYSATFIPTFEGQVEVSIGLLGTNSVRNFKTTIFPETKQEMDLKNRGLKVLKNEYMEIFVNLTDLDVSFNELEEIPKALATLPRLYKLNAKHNHIKQIPWELGNSITLKKLELDYNPIQISLAPILKYNNIEYLKIYIRYNKKNAFDWNLMSTIFKCCTQNLNETDDISILFSVSDFDRSRCVNAVHQMLVQLKLLPQRDKLVNVSKMNLDFGLSESRVCPINTTMLDRLVVTNTTLSVVNVSVKVLKNSQSHRLTVDQTKQKITRGASGVFQFSLSVPYFSSNRIQNVAILDVEGFIYLVGIDLATESQDVYTFEEIHTLIRSTSENQMIVKTPYPIWKVKWRNIDAFVKEVDTAYASDQIKLHRKLNHPSIVQYIGATPLTGFNTVYLLIEYMKNGTLRSILESEIELPWKLRLVMMQDIAKAIHFLHTNKYVHMVLNTANLLVNEYMQVKLCDFGQARDNISIPANLENTEKQYLAPELLSTKDLQPTKQMDTFSFGIITTEIFTRTPPYKDEIFDEKAIIQGHRPQLPKNLFEDIKLMAIYDLIVRCIDGDPSKRPEILEMISLLEVLCHSYQDIDVNFNDSAKSSDSLLHETIQSNELSISPPNDLRLSRELNSSSELLRPPSGTFSPSSGVFSPTSSSGGVSPPSGDLSRPSSGTFSTPLPSPLVGDAIMLRKVGQNQRGIKLYIPDSIETLIKLAASHLKIPVIEIWDVDRFTLTDITMIKPGCIYYGATQSDIDNSN